jgi:hypothetical protein
MGGKRPDQHNIDPAEGSSTNHKWRGEGRSADEHIEDEQKRELQSNPHDQPMIPEQETNPESRELQEKKKAKRAREAEQEIKREAKADEERGGMTEDERVDEMIDESFPASDPPSYP